MSGKGELIRALDNVNVISAGTIVKIFKYGYTARRNIYGNIC